MIRGFVLWGCLAVLIVGGAAQTSLGVFDGIREAVGMGNGESFVEHVEDAVHEEHGGEVFDWGHEGHDGEGVESGHEEHGGEDGGVMEVHEEKRENQGENLPAWRVGRGTYYGDEHWAWSIHEGSCGYGNIWEDEPLGWDVAAIPDVHYEYAGSCG